MSCNCAVAEARTIRSRPIETDSVHAEPYAAMFELLGLPPKGKAVRYLDAAVRHAVWKVFDEQRASVERDKAAIARDRFRKNPTPQNRERLHTEDRQSLAIGEALRELGGSTLAFEGLPARAHGRPPDLAARFLATQLVAVAAHVGDRLVLPWKGSIGDFREHQKAGLLAFVRLGFFIAGRMGTKTIGVRCLPRHSHARRRFEEWQCLTPSAVFELVNDARPKFPGFRSRVDRG